jgi:endonuclease YncB( thermonuclease family)
MKPPSAILVAAAVLAAASAGAEAPWRCVDVIDGDTIVAESGPGRSLRVELFGIDAPELEQPFGPEAREHVAEIAQGREIELSDTGTGTGTVTASVRVDGNDLSDAQIRAGFAWLPQEGETTEDLAIALFMAQSEGTGLWSESEPEHPAVWRKRHRKLPTPTPVPRLSDLAAKVDLSSTDGEGVVIEDIPPRLTQHRESRLLVENMAVVAAVAEGLGEMEAAYDRHCAVGRAPSSNDTGSVWSEELNQWIDGTETTREQACRTLGTDIARVESAIKEARDRTADEAGRFGVEPQIIRDVIDYFDLARF